MGSSKDNLLKTSVSTPGKLLLILDTIIEKKINQSLMLWGPPSIGKSSIVAQASENRGIDLIERRVFYVRFS